MGSEMCIRDRDLVELIENVELGDRQAIETVHFNGVTTDHAVEPTATATTARRGAELAAAVAEVIVKAALQFGGEGAFADAGCIGLGHTDDSVDQGRTHPCTDAGASADRVRGGDVGVGAVVKIEEGALCPLEQDVLLGLGRLVNSCLLYTSPSPRDS